MPGAELRVDTMDIASWQDVCCGHEVRSALHFSDVQAIGLAASWAR